MPVPVLGAAMEREMLRRLLHGDERAYAELLERYEKPLLNFILRYIRNRAVAEELFQETFYRMMRALDDYRPRAGFGTWLFTIARNLCLDHLKRQRRHPEASLDAERGGGGKVIFFHEALRSADAPPPEALERREGLERIHDALKRLPAKLKETLLLRVFHEFSYRDIAHITGAPVGTVKYRVHEALGAVARMLGEERGKERERGDG